MNIAVNKLYHGSCIIVFIFAAVHMFFSAIITDLTHYNSELNLENATNIIIYN